MYSRIVTGSLTGLEAEAVTVETDLSPGLPAVTIVGLPDASVREAKERIRTAMQNGGFPFPMKRITVNLSPADNKKEGTHFDLPIAVGVMTAAGTIAPGAADGYALLGELSLDGSLCAVRGALPLAIGLRKHGVGKVILPVGNAEEAAVLEDLEIYAAAHLSEVAAHLAGTFKLERYRSTRPRKSPAAACYGGSGDGGSGAGTGAGDFADVAGQEEVKRALQVAAAASHNILMAGPPGAGKTMLARRLPGILPSMTYQEKLEVTKICSLLGEFPKERGLIEERPFRAPHHTVSPIALIGGGVKARPGEISLAHCGVLFLDELPEFPRRVLEALRQPLEDERVSISRAGAAVTFPSKFMLVAAMNPCPCGYLGDPVHKCTCTEHQIRQYAARISGPLTDRIDMRVEILPVGYNELCGEEKNPVRRKTSAAFRNEVEAARMLQTERYRGEAISCNSQLTPALLKKYCPLDSTCRELLRNAFEKFGLSARSHQKVIKIARTIADLSGSEKIDYFHLAEALRYRTGRNGEC